MENMLKKNSCYCPLTCGRGDWLPNVSAAVLILFSIFNLPFEGCLSSGRVFAGPCRRQWREDRSPENTVLPAQRFAQVGEILCVPSGGSRRARRLR